MISFLHLNLVIFFLLMTIRTTFSQVTDIENLSQRVETLSSYIKSHDAVLKQVESSMNTYIFKRDYDKVAEIVTSNLELIIHSEMKIMCKGLREFEDSKDNLANKLTKLDSKLEKVLTEVEGIKDISKVARNISYEVTYRTDNLADKETELDSKLEKVLTEVEGIKDISKVARNISYEVSYCTETLKVNHKTINSKLENIFSEVEVIKQNSDSTKNSLAQLPLKEDNLANKQTELDSKLEKVLTEVEGIKDISKVARNISYEVSSCTDVVQENRISFLSTLKKFLQEINDRSVTDITEVARNISLDVAFCKDAARTNQNALDSTLATILAGIKDVTDSSARTRNDIYFSRGGETTCTDLSKTLLSIVKALYHINISLHKYAISNIEKCWKDLPETIIGHKYFLTPNLKVEAAAKYCKDHGGKPFIPKTEDEFLFYVAVTVQPDNQRYSWYPVNDIKEEGHVVLQDGSDYEKVRYKLQKWDSRFKNSEETDCVLMDIFGRGVWFNCNRFKLVFLCQGNKF